MKKRSTLLLILFVVFSTLSYSQNRGELISSSLEKSLSLTEILEIYSDFNLPPALIPIDYSSLEIHKVIYWPLAARGENLIEASGLVTFPIN